jgi:hypothetical protein
MSVGAIETVGDSVVVAGELDARDSLGVHVAARVAMMNDLARWSWRAVREPATLSIAVTCDGQQAVVRVAGPPWLEPTVGPAVQDPMVCVPSPIDTSWPTWRVATVVGGCAMAGAGAIDDRTGLLVVGGLACAAAVAWDMLGGLLPPWL